MTNNKRQVLPLIICSLAAFFYIYDYFIQVAPAVFTDQLMAEFRIGASGLGALGAFFFYSYAGMQIPAGMLLDRFGARKILTFAVFISALGVMLFATTASFSMACFARFIIGFGSAFAFLSALFLASRWFSHQYFALIAGLVQFGGCVGSLIGEAPLAFAVNHYGWRSTLFAIGVFTLFLSVLYWWVIRDGKANHYPKIQPKLTITQRLQMVFTDKQVLWIAVCGFCCWIPVATIGALWGVPYLMQVYQCSNIIAAELCSLFWLGIGIGSPVLGWLSDKIQSRKIPCYIGFGAGVIAALVVLEAPALPMWCVAIALFLLGLMAALQSLTFAIAKDCLPRQTFGTASGLINMAAVGSGAIAQQVIGYMLQANWGGQLVNGLPVYDVHDYQISLVLLPIATVIGLLVSVFMLQETGCQHVVITADVGDEANVVTSER